MNRTRLPQEIQIVSFEEAYTIWQDKRLTQFGQAMSHLGIETIPSCSPQRRGRSERFFGTL